MPRTDHHRIILKFLSEGKLDHALKALDGAEERKKHPGNDVLIPLARALLEAGRSEESLGVLERASISAAFGGDLDQIATQVGMPAEKIPPPNQPGEAEELDTDEVSLPERSIPEDTQPNEIADPKAFEESETTFHRLPERSPGVEEDKPGDLDQTTAMTIPESSDRDTDPLDRRDTWTSPPSPGSRDVTNKLALPDIEVVGFFEAGLGHSDSTQAKARPSPRPKIADAFPQSELYSDARDQRRHEVTARVNLSNLERPRPKSRRFGRREIIGALVLVGAIAVVTVKIIRQQREEAQDLAQIQELQRTDTFASHTHALAILSDLASRQGDGPACAEYALESTLMWCRFGSGDEHRDAALQALETCPESRNSEAAIAARTLLSLGDGDLSGGRDLARDGVDRFPQSARLRTVYALAIEAQGHRERAAEELSMALTIDPSHIPAALNLARISRQLGNRGDARVKLRSIQRQSPQHVESRTELLMLELDALGKAPDRASLEALRTQSSKLVAAAQGQPPAVSAHVALARGRLALMQGQMDNAVVLFGQARRISRITAEASFYISRGLRLGGDLAGALEVSTIAENRDVRLRLEGIRVLLAAGRPESALEELQALSGSSETEITGTEDSGAIMTRLKALALLQKGDTSDAQDALSRQAKRSADSNTLLLQARILISQGYWMEAQSALDAVSKEPWAACAEAALFELRGEPQEAQHILESRGAPRAACTLRLRAMLARRLADNPITEISSLQTLLRVDPLPEYRLLLVEAVWRDRGAHAALDVLRPMITAPPTAREPLRKAAELLASIRADRQMYKLLESATVVGAHDEEIALARARFERLRGRPQLALEAIEGVQFTTAQGAIEKAAALIDLGRAADAGGHLRSIEADICSRTWVEILELSSTVLAQKQGFAAADLELEEALRQCDDRGAKAGVQTLALRRVELGLVSKAPTHRLRMLLQGVPRCPVTPHLDYLTGRVEESVGFLEAARRSYNRALEIDGAHIPSLQRLVELEPVDDHRRRLNELIEPPDDVTSTAKLGVRAGP